MRKSPLFDKQWQPLETDVHLPLNVAQVREAFRGLRLAYAVRKTGAIGPYLGEVFFPDSVLDRLLFGLLMQLEPVLNILSAGALSVEVIIRGQKKA